MGATVAVDVWWADLTQADLALSRLLPPAELARTTEPRRAADRGRRLVAAALLQHAVAAHHGDGSAGPFEVDRTCETCGAQHGRPVVAGGPHVSVAHAGLLVVVAACSTAPVGVDVEGTARFGGSRKQTLAWVRREATLKAGAPANQTQEVGSGTADHVVLTDLQAPLTSYCAALCVASTRPGRAEIAVRSRSVVL